MQTILCTPFLQPHIKKLVNARAALSLSIALIVLALIALVTLITLTGVSGGIHSSAAKIRS